MKGMVCALALGAVLATGADEAGATDDPWQVVVIRGNSQAPAVPPGDGQVAVYRGHSAAPALHRTVAVESPFQLVGGEVAWLVAGRRLIACELRGTFTVGRLAIKCASRALRGRQRQ